MSALETIAQLRAGQRPASGLLHTCRLHAFGSEAYGEESIVERFRTMAYGLPADPVVIATLGHLAVFAGAGAMIADLAGEDIARLWRVGPGTPVLPEPAVSVPFDPDLSQARGDLLFSAREHHQLSADAAPHVEAIGLELARGDTAYRTRAFAIRAFGSAAEGAALFALHRLSAGSQRNAGFFLVAARWSGGDVVIVNDSAGEAAVAATPWMPRIGG